MIKDMTEASDIERVIYALDTVSEKKLLIIELANEVTTKKGELDYDSLADKAKDVNLAIAEAKAYAQATQGAIRALSDLPARKGDDEWEP